MGDGKSDKAVGGGLGGWDGGARDAAAGLADGGTFGGAGCPQRHIDIADYRYPLPEERIALYPLAERDASKLLVYQDGEMRESRFARLGDFLPADTLLVMNETRVVHARLVFHKGTAEPADAALTSAGASDVASASAAGASDPGRLGARIEIFCLEPLHPADIAQAFAARGGVDFLCLIGNNKKWKAGDLCLTFETADGRSENLRATRLRAQGDAFVVRFAYADDLSFSEVLEASGKVPLPPYIRREAEAADAGRYQTVFARHDGSVAAPTAGLHFTENLLADLRRKGIEQARLTLHVGAGTFKPVKEGEIGTHAMHREYVSVPAQTVFALRAAVAAGRPVVPVGTTSMRSLESLYWWGVSLLDGPSASAAVSGVGPSEARDAHPASSGVEAAFELAQWTPYETYGGRLPYPPLSALAALEAYLQRTGAEAVGGYTALMIAPGYPFAFCRGLVTNFHQPQSTLLLLVAALVGDVWRSLYDYALAHGFRFLSYGDGCLFWPPRPCVAEHIIKKE